jgi:hypothetical protein
MRIQLLTFPGCANAAAARELLARVLRSSGVEHGFEELDTHAAATPEPYRAYASPTILVDGVAVGGEARATGCCRLYLDDLGNGGRRLAGLPSEHTLRLALAGARLPAAT